MPTKNTKFYSLILILADFFVLLLAFTIAYILRVQYDHRPLVADVYAVEYFLSLLVIIPIWILVFATLGLYQSSSYNRRLAAGRACWGVCRCWFCDDAVLFATGYPNAYWIRPGYDHAVSYYR